MPDTKKMDILKWTRYNKKTPVINIIIYMYNPKSRRNESYIDRSADFLRDSFGTVWFLTMNAVIFLGWILINSGMIPGFKIFDPFPYGLLTTAVSLEAIFLSIIVLISQNRSSEIDSLRDELDLQINIHSESEITRIVNMVDEIHDHLGLPPEDDAELKKMKEKTNINDLRNKLIRMRKK